MARSAPSSHLLFRRRFAVTVVLVLDVVSVQHLVGNARGARPAEYQGSQPRSSVAWMLRSSYMPWVMNLRSSFVAELEAQLIRLGELLLAYDGGEAPRWRPRSRRRRAG